jgi:hypothetical protein
MDSHRPRDMRVEIELANYLDRVFYPNIGAVAERQFEKAQQHKGVDIILTYKDLKKISVDEKALTHYINKDLPTFAFELTSIQSGTEVEGWLTDQTKITEYYLLIWIWADEEWDLTESSIRKLELILVNRFVILEYLSENGFSLEELRNKAREIRKNANNGAQEKGDHKGFYFFLSKNLKEEPVNVVISKDVLRKLAKYKFLGPKANPPA